MEVIRATNITRTFTDGDQQIQVLKGIDLRINAGEFVSITGASGTGKSTLVYQLGLLDNPTTGEILLEGKNTKEMNVREKTMYRLNQFGFVFQDYALIPELSAWENIALPVLMRGVSEAEAKEMAVKILEKVGMKDREHHKPSQLSGGESQRVSIARAIVHNPSILFADEPTANLDTDRSRQIIDLFHTLNKSGQTIVMVTHELEYAREATRLIVMGDGVIDKDEQLR